MIILETALETAGLTYVFPDGNGIKNIAFQVKRGEIYHYKAVTVLAACSERLIVFKKG